MGLLSTNALVRLDAALVSLVLKLSALDGQFCGHWLLLSLMTCSMTWLNNSERSSDLLHHHINGVTVLHLKLSKGGRVYIRTRKALMCIKIYTFGRIQNSCFAYLVGGVSGLDTLSVIQEAHTVQALSLAFAVSFHQLLELCRALDLKEHLRLVL